MKTRFLLLSLFVVGCPPTFSQDLGAQMTQQAIDQSVQSTIQMQQQQIDSMNNSNLQTQNTLNLFDFPESTGPVVGSALKPKFSVEPGKVSPGTVVRIQTATHYATIYYTTDGWSPTAASRRYTGPITIDGETHIQALAVGPNLLHSPLVRADYWTQEPSKAPPAKPVPAPALVTDGTLHAGTVLHLTTTTEISSKSAQVGDKVPLQLDQDLKVGDTVVAAIGTPVEALLTIADPAGKHGPPGDLVFKVQALVLQGKTVALSGAQSLEGQNGRDNKDAVIEPDMAVVAIVSKDTSLNP